MVMDLDERLAALADLGARDDTLDQFTEACTRLRADLEASQAGADPEVFRRQWRTLGLIWVGQVKYLQSLRRRVVGEMAATN